MAIQVPRYDSQQVQERLTPQVNRTPNAPIEAFGGGQALSPITQGVPAIAKGLEQVIQTDAGIANQIAAEEKDKANRLRMGEERRALNDWELTSIYDPENGAINRRGKDALGMRTEITNNWNKFLEERRKNIKDDAQLEAFNQLADARWASISKWAAGHEVEQAKAFETSELAAGLESSKERAAVNPANVPVEVGYVRQQIMQRAQSEGWGQEQIKQELQKNESDLYGRVIGGMLAKGNDLGAQSFFTKVKDKMDPDAATKIEADLVEGNRRGQSQRIVDKLLTDYSDLGAAREALKEQIKDPQLRDAADDRLKMEFALRANEDSARRDQNFMNAYSIVEQTKKADNIPPAQYNALTPSQRTAIRALEKQVNQVGPQKQDDKVYLEYLGMPIQQIARVSEAQLIEKVRPNVSEASFKEIARRWEAAREGVLKGNKTKEAEFKSLFSDDEMLLNNMKKAGVAGLAVDTKPKDYTSTQSATILEFQEKFNDRMQAYFHQTGKQPNDEAKQKIVRDLTLDRVFVQNKTFGIDLFSKDTEASGRELAPEDRKRAYVPIDRIPPASQEAIRRLIQSAGKRVTNDKIQRIYAASVSNDSELVRSIIGE